MGWDRVVGVRGKFGWDFGLLVCSNIKLNAIISKSLGSPMNPAYLSRCDLSYLAALWIETETRSEMNRLPKKSTKKSNIFSNSTPDPMKSTPVTGRGTYIGHAELSYHGPCHAFHLLQVTTSTWHCLMHDSTLKLINFVFSVFWFWLQIFHEFPMRLDISVGNFEGPLILRHTSSIHSHFGELFTSRRPQKKNTHMTWHRP